MGNQTLLFFFISKMNNHWLFFLLSSTKTGLKRSTFKAFVAAKKKHLVWHKRGFFSFFLVFTSVDLVQWSKEEEFLFSGKKKLKWTLEDLYFRWMTKTKKIKIGDCQHLSGPTFLFLVFLFFWRSCWVLFCFFVVSFLSDNKTSLSLFFYVSLQFSSCFCCFFTFLEHT